MLFHQNCCIMYDMDFLPNKSLNEPDGLYPLLDRANLYDEKVKLRLKMTYYKPFLFNQ
jgi:hypothetical protein